MTDTVTIKRIPNGYRITLLRNNLVQSHNITDKLSDIIEAIERLEG